MRLSPLLFGLVFFVATATAEDASPPKADEGGRTFRVVVLGPEGKPLEGANVKAGIWTEEKNFKATRNYKTDADGAAQVELPKTFYIVRLWASKEPLVTLFANWEQNELASGKGLPGEYTFRLEHAVRAGGRIVNEQGEPIAGAKVQVSLAGDGQVAGGDGRVQYNTWLATGDDAAVTDADGRWQIKNAPRAPDVELSLRVSHPHYVSDEYWGESQQAAGITTAQLHEQKATLTLKRGVVVSGQVTDSTGKPVDGVWIVPCAGSPNVEKQATTDVDGRFELSTLPPKLTTLLVLKPGWSPQIRRVNLQAGIPPQDFTLQPGRRIELQIVDAAGKPVPEAMVTPGNWNGVGLLEDISHAQLKLNLRRRTDDGGLWTWDWAPPEAIKLSVGGRGFAPVEVEIDSDVSKQQVVLKPEHRITGRVTDAETGKPIPSFTVIPIDVFRPDWLHAERGNAKRGKDGQLDYLAKRTDIPLRVRIEAEGYRTQDGPQFRVGDDSPLRQDFVLVPSPPVSGFVADAAGKPVADAEVLIATPTQPADFSSDWGNHKATTDKDGQFQFPDPGEPFVVLARTDKGFAQAEYPAEQHDVGMLRLEPWAQVRGQFVDGGQPVRGARVILQPVRIESLDRPRVESSLATATDADGRFEFPRVPPGPANVRVYLGPWKDEGFRSGPSVPLELEEGEHAELALGSGGATVTGKVTLTGTVPADLDCTFSINYLVRREPGIPPPAEIARLGFDVRQGWRDTWKNTREGTAYFSTLQSWFVKLAPDGSLRISGVPPGDYDLAVAVYSRPDG